ncbi:MAG: hypothetical protein J7M09_05285 [Deltaproteobacteria bacterium]|nr:hypothetical protein [Candidatus Tharpella sp.]
MEISNVSSESMVAMAVAAQQQQASLQTQVAMLQQIAEAQQQVALILAEGGIGQSLNIMA